jgi:hypothetical protein
MALGIYSLPLDVPEKMFGQASHRQDESTAPAATQSASSTGIGLQADAFEIRVVAALEGRPDPTQAPKKDKK